MDTSVIINQMLILFVMIIMGFILNKVHVLGKTQDSIITKVIIYFSMPCMVLNAVLSQSGPKEYKQVGIFIILALIMYIILPIIAFFVVRIPVVPKNLRGIYQFMIIFGNVGFMGFPLVSAVFGPESVLYAGIFNIAFNLLSYSYGVYIVSNDDPDNSGAKTDFKLSFKKFLSPGISVSLIALILYFTGIEFPEFIKSPVASFGNMTTPMAMLVIGSTLANMKLKEVFTDWRAYLFVAFRNILLPIVLIPVMKLTIKDPFSFSFTLIMLLVPIANSSVLYSKEYGSDENFAAKCVIISTLLSIVTIPSISMLADLIKI